MKRKYALISLALAVVMLFSLTACGKKTDAPAPSPSPDADSQQLPPADADPNLPATPEQPATDLPGVDAVLDPSLVNMGKVWLEDRQVDAWYKDGVSGGDYIFFETADNSDLGYAYVRVEGGERKETLLCTVTMDMHVIDASATAETSTIDLVFADHFRVYDYKSGTWYVRGDPQQLCTLFADIQFVCQDSESNTLLLKADGTGVELFDGAESALTWVMTSASTVTYNDGEHEHELQIITDENGALTGLQEANFRIFVPAA